MGNIQLSDTEPNRMNHHMGLQGALLLSNGYIVFVLGLLSGAVNRTAALHLNVSLIHQQ